MFDTNTTEQLRQQLQNGNFTLFRKEIVEYNEVDIAAFLEELEDHLLIRVFRLLPKDLSTDVFSYLTPTAQEKIVEAISAAETSELIEQLYLDDAVDFLEEVPAGIVKKVLAAATPDTRKLINRFMDYPENSAGSITTVEYVELKVTMTAKEALGVVRSTGVDKETVYTLYVIDASRHLLGTVALRSVIMANDDDSVSAIMEDNFIYAQTLEDQESVAQKVRRYDLLSIPVVDNEMRLIGIITADDVIDVIQQENTEDFQVMAAITPTEEPYLHSSVLRIAKSRVVWLLILMISATFTGMIISNYSDLLSTAVVLASFIPMLMDTGGNCGSQTAVVIIRSMALGELNTRDIGIVLWKEFRVSIVVGLVLSVVNFARIMLFSPGVSVNVPTALVVCASLFITVVLAKSIGALLPILAKMCKLDPAIMAGPLITTIVDALSLIIFFNISVAVLGL